MAFGRSDHRFLREAGWDREELCRRHVSSEDSDYMWCSKFGGMTVSGVKHLLELETENTRLKKLLAGSAVEIQVTRRIAKEWLSHRSDGCLCGR